MSYERHPSRQRVKDVSGAHSFPLTALIVLLARLPGFFFATVIAHSVDWATRIESLETTMALISFGEIYSNKSREICDGC